MVHSHATKIFRPIPLKYPYLHHLLCGRGFDWYIMCQNGARGPRNNVSYADENPGQVESA